MLQMLKDARRQVRFESWIFQWTLLCGYESSKISQVKRGEMGYLCTLPKKESVFQI